MIVENTLPGIRVTLTGDELAVAVDTYLVAHGIHVRGPRTISINGKLCSPTQVFVDPSGSVMFEGRRYNGNGTIDN